MGLVDKDNLKLVIFDLDGVIFDIVDAVRESASDGVQKYKLGSSVEGVMGDLSHLIEKLQAVPIPKIVLNSYDLLQIPALEGISLIKRLRIALYFYSRFREYKDAASIFPGIPRVIQALHEREIPLAVFTNQRADYAREVLEKHELDQYFEKVIGFNEVKNTKPDPEGLKLLLEAFEVADPRAVLFVGDMASDIQAGKAAGVRTIAYGSGLVDPSKLEAENPDILVKDAEGLYAALFE